MLRRILLAALLAGGIAGLLVSAAQEWRVLPLLAKAEAYESGGAANGVPALVMTWSTLVANLVTGVGFALVLTGAFALRGREVDWRAGVLWGLGGYAAFALAPSLGLPPELPGTVTADIHARQGWWLATAAATAGGLALIVLGGRALTGLAGAVLIALPHAIGAPQPESFGGVVPAELAASYVAASLVTTGLFWLVLGAGAGYFYERLGRRPG